MKRWLTRVVTGIGAALTCVVVTGLMLLLFCRLPTWVGAALGYEVGWSCPDEGLCVPGIEDHFWADKLVMLSPFLALAVLCLLASLAVALWEWLRGRFCR
jgi:hypothetical protein